METPKTENEALRNKVEELRDYIRTQLYENKKMNPLQSKKFCSAAAGMTVSAVAGMAAIAILGKGAENPVPFCIAIAAVAIVNTLVQGFLDYKKRPD